MTVEHSGGGDPDRSLALLWRDRDATPEPSRGRRPTLTLTQIVTAAIGLADAHGLDAASMHRVAKELGAGTMTLYTYVPGKHELLDLMVDEVLAERRFPGPGQPRPENWREQVELYSERTRAMYLRHPWLRRVSMVRPALGPGMMAGREYLLSTVADIGLTPREITAAANSLAAFIDAHAALSAETAELEKTTGHSADVWWHRRTSFWETYFDMAANPTTVRVWEGGGFDLDVGDAEADSFRFGLERLLDGIEATAAKTG